LQNFFEFGSIREIHIFELDIDRKTNTHSQSFPNMSIRHLLIVAFTLVFTLLLHSQDKLDDVVYLNNGTFLRGKITLLIPGKSLKICLGDKDTLEIQMNDIKVIKKEKFPEKINPNYEDRVKTWGYTNITEITLGSGLLEGLDRYRDPPQSQFSVMLSTFNGVTITPYIQMGVGVGLEIWSSRGFIPIYLDFRSNILKCENTPFFYVNAGYSPGWIHGETGLGFGGAIAGIGAGARVKIYRRLLMVFSLGYRFQQTGRWQVMNGVQTKATLDAHFVSLKLGFIF